MLDEMFNEFYFQAVAGGEMTWVTRDYISHSQGELTVRSGQQVELLERLESSEAQLVRVRLQLMEGLVPLSCLQIPPGKGGQLSKQGECEGRWREDRPGLAIVRLLHSQWATN